MGQEPLTLSFATALARSALLPSSGSGHRATGMLSLVPQRPPSGGGTFPSSISWLIHKGLNVPRLDAKWGPPMNHVRMCQMQIFQTTIANIPFINLNSQGLICNFQCLNSSRLTSLTIFFWPDALAVRNTDIEIKSLISKILPPSVRNSTRGCINLIQRHLVLFANVWLNNLDPL